jgi:SAM-dependent methyltransferase
MSIKTGVKKAQRLWWLARTRRFAYLAYVARNRIRGLDFGYVDLERMGFSPSQTNNHTNSGGPDLARMVRSLDIPAGTSALDLGSGKGGAVLTLIRLGYARVVGVEVAPELTAVARRNAERSNCTNVEFVCADAADFRDLDSFAHIYLYNPFPSSVMKEVLHNLALSLGRAPRTLTLVYCNPILDDLIVGSGLFTREREIDARIVNLVETRGAKCFIYVHRS